MLISVAFLTGFVVLWTRLEFRTRVLIDSDSNYHIRVAELLRADPWLPRIPWGQYTIFQDGFSDKEYLFHLALVPVTFAADMFRAAKWANVALAGLVMATVLLVLHRQRVSAPAAWAVLLCSSGAFLVRLDPLRPHLVAVILSLLYVDGLLRARSVPVFVCALLFPLAYTAFHLVVVFLALFVLVETMSGGQLPRRAIGLTALGLVLGLVVHPHFPRILRNFWVVNEVTAYAMSGVTMGFGVELLAPSLTDFMRANGLVLAAVAAVLALHVGEGPRPRLARDARYLLLLAATFLLLALRGARYVEYGVPFAVLFCAVAAARLWESRPARRRLLAGLAGVLLVAAVAKSFTAVAFTVGDIDAEAAWIGNLEPAGAWIATHVPPGELIFTCAWDDTIPLLRHAPGYRYLGLLDPMYSYAADPERFRRWYAFGQGQLRDRPPSAYIRADYPEARFGFCRTDVRAVIAQLEADPAIRILDQRPAYVVFRLVESAKLPAS